MGESRETLDLDDIIDINRQLIATAGGFFVDPDNLLNRASLEYILDALDASLFGQECYPTIPQKAAALGWTIISGHVFRATKTMKVTGSESK